ncbi:MAG TPA: PilT/PilU family type 4a pilus ATPase [Candidatus Paceibacterota bacterium]|nr:PilT/PilU family type 4a pilus ATPase [Candidatus Paceibacterota bacterium]
MNTIQEPQTQATGEAKKVFETLVQLVIKEAASDLHLAEGRQPMMRVSGFLVPILQAPVITRDHMLAITDIIMTPEYKQEFMKEKEIDFSYSYGDMGRFRGNGFVAQGRISIALRLIPGRIKTLDELRLPSLLESFTKREQGFFLCVGPVGQGKSTTLAALIEIINQDRMEHIITIEDPIEYIFSPKKSVIDQREVGIDTKDFGGALKHALRQDVNVLLVGEMRDLETISMAVTAAETGHLVFSTLHTNTAAQTIDRIIDVFPAEQQGQIRLQLAASMTGIFSQRLIPRISGGLVPAYELLINNSAVSNLIREKRTHELNTVIETSAQQGMIDLNRSLVELVRQGEISIENAYAHSANPKVLDKML